MLWHGGRLTKKQENSNPPAIDILLLVTKQHYNKLLSFIFEANFTATAIMLSIVIVNYNSAQLIIDCVQSVQEQTKSIPYEIIVVDNNSADDSLARIQHTFPNVAVHQMGYNSGFSRANNAGIHMAKGDVILLLNPDTLVLDGAVEKCYIEFINDPAYAACGVQLIEKDHKPQISGNYFMPGGINVLLPLPYWGKFLRWLGYALGSKKPNIPEATTKTNVDWINGAYLMVKKESLAIAGLMDEDFFLYSEEIEWCSRLNKAGKLCIYGQYKVIHLQGEVSAVAFDSFDKGYYNLYDKKGLQIMLSSFLRVRKQYGTGWFLFALLNYLFAIPVSFFGAVISGLFKPSKILAELTTYMGFYKNTWIILTRYIGKIISGKPYFYKVL
jgi:GT2 family glycosyltransferase